MINKQIKLDFINIKVDLLKKTTPKRIYGMKYWCNIHRYLLCLADHLIPAMNIFDKQSMQLASALFLVNTIFIKNFIFHVIDAWL